MLNEKARDLENRSRFSGSMIDESCCFTSDTTIGENSHILRGSILNHSHIGSYSYVGKNALIQSATIGRYCSIANDVIIGLGAHPINMFSTSPLFYKTKNPLQIRLVEKDQDFEEYKSISIGNDVWIGARVVIMGGISIGHGAVLAAGSVVTRDVPPYAVVGGVPAKIIKFRFSEEVQNALLKTRWWEKEADEVYRQKDILSSICEGNAILEK
ncbi:xenobiotic acyltransferase family protein [Pontibacter cellulosilyticus]|uniref:Antibiotic acetyltransferase n=1 Tax=Pontibacter cellulosilyticus TaxID=1720253 RepID=A0A923N4S8_9BACT|nr:CatB-related O-acetyltransferase [Pontibacter cellulosilyticus]MBC5992533.1 antibiotic acetyltransferase [Pontibacter cellulosilyticus]